MRIYMDESGNGNPKQPLIVGAAEIYEDFDDVEPRVQELHRALSARRSWSGLESFEKFRQHGFHASTDPLEVSVRFAELMQDTFFRAYVYVTDRTSTLAGSSEAAQIEYMYEAMLGDLLLRHRKAATLSCYIEENESLKQLARDLPERATRCALQKLGRRIDLPTLEIAMVPKTQAMSMAIIDYVMLAVARWIKSGWSEDPQSLGYRAFREVEPSISVLYSLEQGLIANRRMPLH